MTKNELMSILDLPRHDFINSEIPQANEMADHDVANRATDQNSTVPDYGTDNGTTKSVVMDTNSYDVISYVDQPSSLQANKSPGTESRSNADQYYGDDQPSSEQMTHQIYQQVITRAHSDADIAKMDNPILSRQNSESSNSVTLPPISWSSKSDYSKPDGRPGSVQPKLYHEPKLDWRDKMDAHFTKKFGTHTRTTIIQQGPNTHTHTQNLPLTRSVSVPARMFDPACSTSRASCHDELSFTVPREMTYPPTTYGELPANYIADEGASSGQNSEEHQTHGNAIIYYHHPQMNSECESADIHYTNTYSVAANQNQLFQSGPETMICYATLPAVKSANQKPDLVANQIMAQQIQLANSIQIANSAATRDSENGLDLNIASNYSVNAEIPVAPPGIDQESKKVPRIEYEPETDQESRPVRVSEGQISDRKTVLPVGRHRSNIQTTDISSK